MGQDKETSERLQRYLTQYHHKYPKVWKLLDKFRAQRDLSEEDNWKNWCFCPLEVIYSIISHIAVNSINVSLDVGILGGLAGWRATQGIYRFDKTVFEAVWQTKLSGNLPIEILYHLPEWCLYVETPNKTVENIKLNGFFVYLNRNQSNHRDELRFIFDTEDQLFCIPIYLSKSTILESLETVLLDAAFQGEKIGIDPFRHRDTLYEVQSLIEPLISLTLYLCSQISEINEFENRLPINYNLKHKRIFPPKKPQVWNVSYRLGSALRQTLNEQTTEKTSGSERNRPRPHIRRAHWHGF